MTEIGAAKGSINITKFGRIYVTNLNNLLNALLLHLHIEYILCRGHLTKYN